MKTERDFGREYAESVGETETVNVDEMVSCTVDIPDGDYVAMVATGIDNPDAREYWAGYNEYVRDR